MGRTVSEDRGPDTHVCRAALQGLLEVTADTAEYWESPGKAAMLVHLVKGLVTDDKAQDEDDDSSGVVQL